MVSILTAMSPENTPPETAVASCEVGRRGSRFIRTRVTCRMSYAERVVLNGLEGEAATKVESTAATAASRLRRARSPTKTVTSTPAETYVGRVEQGKAGRTRHRLFMTMSAGPQFTSVRVVTASVMMALGVHRNRRRALELSNAFR